MSIPLPPPSVTLYWCPFCGRTEQVDYLKHVPFEQLGGPYCVGGFTPIGYTMPPSTFERLKPVPSPPTVPAAPRKSPLRLGALRHAELGNLHVGDVSGDYYATLMSTNVYFRTTRARAAIDYMVECGAITYNGAITEVGRKLLKRWTS